MIINQIEKHMGSRMMDQLEDLDSQESGSPTENDSSEDLRAVCNNFIRACIFTYEKSSRPLIFTYLNPDH